MPCRNLLDGLTNVPDFPSDSMTIVLPVFNRQSYLQREIETILEFTEDLSTAVQIMIVDDGSRDGTPEVVEDLRIQYPQIDSIRLREQKGPIAAAQQGLQHARGDLIFLRESYQPLTMEELVPLWNLRSDPTIVMARARTRIRRIDESLMKRLMNWGKRIEDHWLGKAYQSSELQMIRREAVEKMDTRDDGGSSLEVKHFAHRRVTPPTQIAEHSVPIPKLLESMDASRRVSRS